jgi:hypothetical protein
MSQEAGELLSRLLGLLDARPRIVVSMELEQLSFARSARRSGSRRETLD